MLVLFITFLGREMHSKAHVHKEIGLLCRQPEVEKVFSYGTGSRGSEL